MLGKVFSQSRVEWGLEILSLLGGPKKRGNKETPYKATREKRPPCFRKRKRRMTQTFWLQTTKETENGAKVPFQPRKKIAIFILTFLDRENELLAVKVQEMR